MPTYPLTLDALLVLAAAGILGVEAFIRSGVERLRPLAFALIALAVALAAAC